MEPKDFFCMRCKHFYGDKFGCDAFPEGIPEEVSISKDKHTKPIKGQKNTIVFEVRDENYIK